jgi:stearoyl-CoA desaturase (delta-9 desaturase)
MAVASCAAMFVLSLVGVEAGYHRHFAHKSFKTTRGVRLLLAGLGSTAFQGSVLWWVGVHRIHHKHADRPGDPHSPFEGLVHAHVGWLFKNLFPVGWQRRARDLYRDEVVRTATRRHYTWAVGGLLAPALLVGLLSQSWHGVLMGFLWGGLVRVFLVNHVVWSINSICHSFGSRPYATRDRSRNNALLSLPSLGFSWHNNHHAFPGSAINAHRWWQFDFCGLVILALSATGLAWDVRKAADVRRAPSDSLVLTPVSEP